MIVFTITRCSIAASYREKENLGLERVYQTKNTSVK